MTKYDYVFGGKRKIRERSEKGLEKKDKRREKEQKHHD
jgi:hypothetical protein